VNHSSLKVNFTCRRNCWGLLQLHTDYDITEQLPIRYSAFVKYWRRNGSTMGQHISYLLTSRMSGEGYCATLTEFCTPTKQVRLKKCAEMKPIVKSVQDDILLMNFLFRMV
jgi:hypothetical protein